MRVRGNQAPAAAFSVSEQPGEPNRRWVRFFENVSLRTETDPVTNERAEFFEWDEWSVVVPYRENLEADIEGDFDEWVSAVKSLFPGDVAAAENSVLREAISALTDGEISKDAEAADIVHMAREIRFRR